MPIREILASGALSLGLVLTLVAAPATAQPYGKGGNYSPVLAPRPAPDRTAKAGQGQADCACPMAPETAAQAQPVTPPQPD